jgi:Holliday junction resolvasome RuvABC DNA-binding subunit
MTKVTKKRTKKNNRKVKSKKKKNSEDEGNDEEESKPQRPRISRELRALGFTPAESESANTINETPREVYSTMASGPGVPSTFEEEFLDP